MILVEYDAREEGRKNGIDSFCCSVYPENQKAIAFLEHHGFQLDGKEEDYLLYKKTI